MEKLNSTFLTLLPVKEVKLLHLLRLMPVYIVELSAFFIFKK